MESLRLASVSFVNADPLNYGFLHGPQRALASIVLVEPSRIAGMLERGEADAGLLPSIDYQRLSGLELIPDVCIASRGRARSVYLASKAPIETIRRVALDTNSHTSAALLKIVLAHRGVRDVVWGERAPRLRDMLRDHDAALLIGDPALTADTDGLIVLDLAAAWFEITGLPFVFALWAARRPAVTRGGSAPFLESLRLGEAHITDIARTAAGRLRLEPATIEDYLRNNIHYRLGAEELRGLDLFYRQAHELGLVPQHRPIPIPGMRQPAVSMSGGGA